MEMNPILIRCIVVMCIAVLTSIVVIALPYWWTNRIFVSSSSGFGYDYGVFKHCIDISRNIGFLFASTSTTSESTCSSIEDPPSWLRGVQAMLVISILIMCGCLPLVVLYSTVLKDKHTIVSICSVGCYIAGFLWSIGVVVFLIMRLVNLKYYVGMPHACFYFALVADGMMTSCGKMILKVRPRDASDVTTAGNTQPSGTGVNVISAGTTAASPMTTAGVFVPANQGMPVPGYYGMQNIQQPNVYLQMTAPQQQQQQTQQPAASPHYANTVNMSKDGDI